MAIQRFNFDGREVFIGEPSELLSSNPTGPFAVLIAASCDEEQKQLLGFLERILNLGCKEFCCIGLKAESLHDHLDSLIEKADFLDVVTTSHKDSVEGCEYFLFGAGGQELTLYALISKHPEFLKDLSSASQAD